MTGSCRFGRHRWTRWASDQFFLMIKGVERERMGQTRTCTSCGLEQFRWVD